MATPLKLVHYISVHYSFRAGIRIYRYQCRCGKKGKYHEYEAAIYRGARQHVRAHERANQQRTVDAS